MTQNPDYILRIKDLHTQFIVGSRTVKAVDGVDLNVRRGKTLGLVGESGCGKSVTAHSIMKLLPKAGRIPCGEIMLSLKNGEEFDILKLRSNSKRLRQLRGRDISMIFQSPMSSLNPVYKVGDQIVEMVQSHEKCSKNEAMKRDRKSTRLNSSHT